MESSEVASKYTSQLEAAFQAITDGVFILDMKGEFVFANEAEAHICGYQSVEEMKKGLSYFAEVFELRELDGTLIPLENWPAARVLRGESLRQMEVQGKRIDTGQEWYFSFTGEPVFNEQGQQTLAVIITRDLTATRQIEQEKTRLIAREQAALEASKMKSSFMATVSHEIRTPLHVILGLVELLKNTKLQSNQSEYVEAVQQASENLLAIVNDILDISKIEAGKMKLEITDFKLRDLLNEIDGIFRPMILQKNLAFQISTDPHLPEKLRGDSRRILQILNNLLSNAVKFTTQGQISLRLWQQENPSSVCFEIRDTGKGISPENLEKIFFPFTQEDVSMSRQFGGTGLGLTIARELATSMNGDIKVESSLGQGSAFTFRFPLVPQSSESQSSKMADEEQPLTGFHALIVEDNLINQKILISLLKKAGAEVSISSSLKESAESFVALGVQLVLVNSRFLISESTDLAKFHSLCQSQKVAVMAISDEGDSREKAQCEQLGISEVLRWPVSPSDLVRTATRLVGARQR